MLEKSGKLVRIPGARGIVTPGPEGTILLPILGVAAAGRAIEVIESDPSLFPVPAGWCRGECYLLRIRGNSMVPDVMDGDLVVVEASDDVQVGAIHVCWVPHEGATIKRVRSNDNAAELVAKNGDFVPVEAPAGTIVQGRVVGVFRSLALR